MTLTEFLLARIAEDEEWARESASPLYSDAEKGTPAHSSRILAECEAKRLVMKLHQADRGLCRTCSMPTDDPPYYFGPACPTLRALALAYADHPDYNPEWKP